MQLGCVQAFRKVKSPMFTVLRQSCWSNIANNARPIQAFHFTNIAGTIAAMGVHK
jgi:hypothetical protein